MDNGWVPSKIVTYIFIVCNSQVDPKHVDIESLNQHAAELLSADGNSNQAMMIVETMDDINDRCA